MIRVQCPICQRLMEGAGPEQWPEFPFCSPRCRLIDLGRWLNGSYGLPTGAEGEEAPAEDAETDAP